LTPFSFEKKNTMAIKFGRYNDSHKPKEKVNFWREALKLYEQNKHSDSYLMLLNYLKDDNDNNLIFSKDAKKIEFKIFQGTKIVNGKIDKKNIEIVCYVCEYEKPVVSFMRRLMELNYTLNYCRFAFDKNLVCLKFESKILNCPPKKLFYALKEVATVADKQDDILISKFNSLKPYDNAEIENIPLKEKKIKVTYFYKWIDEVLKRASALNQDLFAGGISYMLLNLLYKIDYLISPEGNLVNDLEKVNYVYYGKENYTDTEKNKRMMDEFIKLNEMEKKELYKYLYMVIYTFGISNPSKHETISDLINMSMKNTHWYCENNYPDLALTILEFIATKSLFSYGIHKPTRQLFHLQINIMNQDFFKDLGYKENYYDPVTNKFNQKQIKNRIKVILEENKDQFGKLDFEIDKLKFDSLYKFIESYIEQIKGLKLN
jgi:hypothetical protein